MPQVVVVVVTALAAFAAVLLAMRTVPHADADDDNEAMTNNYCFDQEDDNYYDHYHDE